MEFLLAIICIVLGLFLLAKGADFLVDGSSNIAKKFHIPEILIGLTIVAIGTSLPELVISVTAAVNGENAISLGNVIGSNFANLFLVIGVCATMRPFHVKKQTRFIDQPVVVLCTILLYLIVINDGVISRFEGVTLLLFTVLYISYTILMGKFRKVHERL
jgi:cation:H+ antiporter